MTDVVTVVVWQIPHASSRRHAPLVGYQILLARVATDVARNNEWYDIEVAKRLHYALWFNEPKSLLPKVAA
jgi:hypothetical protein